MEPDNEEPAQLCTWCKQRPAASTYDGRNGKWSAFVCSSCYDGLEIKDAFEWGLVETWPLIEEDRFDDMLAWLDNFKAANQHRDHDGWMVRAVARHREITLWQAGRYEEALAACDVVEQLGFEDDWYRYAAGSARASVLEGLGRHAEALAVFEEAFRYHDPRAFQSIRHLMVTAIEYSSNAGQPVNESWREVAQNVAAHYGVEFPVRPTLAESITALFEMTEDKSTSGPPEPDENA